MEPSKIMVYVIGGIVLFVFLVAALTFLLSIRKKRRSLNFRLPDLVKPEEKKKEEEQFEQRKIKIREVKDVIPKNAKEDTSTDFLTAYDSEMQHPTEFTEVELSDSSSALPTRESMIPSMEMHTLRMEQRSTARKKFEEESRIEHEAQERQEQDPRRAAPFSPPRKKRGGLFGFGKKEQRPPQQARRQKREKFDPLFPAENVIMPEGVSEDEPILTGDVGEESSLGGRDLKQSTVPEVDYQRTEYDSLLEELEE